MREEGRMLKREGERERERQGEYENRVGKEKSLKKQMCRYCMPTMNMNTLCEMVNHFSVSVGHRSG